MEDVFALLYTFAHNSVVVCWHKVFGDQGRRCTLSIRWICLVSDQVIEIHLGGASFSWTALFCARVGQRSLLVEDSLGNCYHDK